MLLREREKKSNITARQDFLKLGEFSRWHRHTQRHRKIPFSGVPADVLVEGEWGEGGHSAAQRFAPHRGTGDVSHWGTRLHYVCEIQPSFIISLNTFLSGRLQTGFGPTWNKRIRWLALRRFRPCFLTDASSFYTGVEGAAGRKRWLYSKGEVT